MLRFLSRMPLRSGAWRVFMVLVAAVAAFTLPASKAAAQINDQHVPIGPLTLFNPCTGEVLTGSGFEHLRESFTSTPNFHISIEANLESFQATTPLGVKYVVPEQIAEHEVADQDFMPENVNVEEMFQLIRQGEDGTFVLGDDFYSNFKMHFTVNANGVLTVDDFEFTDRCQ